MDVGRTAVAEGEIASSEARTFEAFFRVEHRGLFGALYLVTGSRQEAEELMQDAFLRVLERWGTGRILDPTAYLYRTALNLFRMRRRHASVVARRAVRVSRGRDDLEAAEARHVVDRGLARATRRQRAALVLTDLLGYSSEEAGIVLGIRASTVRVLAKRARDAVRASMEGTEEEIDD